MREKPISFWLGLFGVAWKYTDFPYFSQLEVQISWDFFDYQEKYRFPVYFSKFGSSLEIYGFSVFFANGSPDQLGLFGPSRKIQVSRIFLKFWAFLGNIRIFRIFRKWESRLVGIFWTIKKNTGFPYISQILGLPWKYTAFPYFSQMGVQIGWDFFDRQEKYRFPVYFTNFGPSLEIYGFPVYFANGSPD